MQVYSKDSSCYLVAPSEIQNVKSSLSERDLIPLREVLRWTRSFLSSNHPQLGRDGPVCPFTKPSIGKDLFWLTVYRESSLSMERLRLAIMKYRDWFLELEPVDGFESQYKTILVLIPDFGELLPLTDLDAIQRSLKSEFVNEGLMIGQFYETCEEQGVWNPDFRPLRSTVPMLVIRRMVHSDFPFMKGNQEYVNSYLRIFGEDVL